MRVTTRTTIFVAIFIAFLLFCLGIQGCGKEKKETQLLVWGLGEGEHMMGIYAAMDVFERQHPGVRVVRSTAGRQLNPQKLMSAIAGGVAPDVIHQDRFTISGWASRDAFMPLDPFIARDRDKPYAVRKEDYYPACWEEAVYQGKVYALPYGADARALYYNKALLREAGFVDAKGEVIPPTSWDDLIQYNQKLTTTNERGELLRIGFSPLFGPAGFYLYGWQNGGDYMNPQGTRCTLDDLKIVEALQWIVNYYDAVGGRPKIKTFEAIGFLSGAMDPFLIGRMPMVVDGDWKLSNIARYKPDMEFGVMPVPPPKGMPSITWSGGFSFAIPVGCRHPELAWELINWMVSPEAWEIRTQVQLRFNQSRGVTYVPALSSNLKANEMIQEKFVDNNPGLSENLKIGYRMFVDLMPRSKFRPVTPVGQKLWDEHSRAAEFATYHRMTAQEALRRGRQEVQKELDRLLRTTKEVGKPIRWGNVALTLLVPIMLGLAFLSYRHRRLFRMGEQRRREMWAGFLCISPWAVGFLVFTAGPLVASIILSFADYDVLHPATWMGLKNYGELLTDDPMFWKSLGNTLYMLLGVPLSMAVSLGLALLLNAKVKGMTVYRTVFYLPAIVPVVASSILWIWVLQPSSGLLNSLLRMLGMSGPLWLQSPAWSKPSIILMGLWGAGGGMIIWLAGLKGIPQHLYESAEIDGANWWAKFWHITIPMLTPYIFFNLIMGIIGHLQIFTQAYIMTEGGPVDSTLFYVYYLFNNAFQYFKMGYASAMAWILFIIILALTLFQLKLAPRWVYYEAEQKK